MNRKSGQFICYKTGQFYLLLTVPAFFIAMQINIIYITRGKY